MQKFKKIINFLIFCLLISNINNMLATESIFSKKNFLKIIIPSMLVSGLSYIFYKKNKEFRKSIIKSKNKIEDKFYNDIVVPAVIKWEELKEENILAKNKNKIFITATSIGIIIGSLLYYFKFKNKTGEFNEK